MMVGAFEKVADDVERRGKDCDRPFSSERTLFMEMFSSFFSLPCGNGTFHVESFLVEKILPRAGRRLDSSSRSASSSSRVVAVVVDIV